MPVPYTRTDRRRRAGAAVAALAALAATLPTPAASAAPGPGTGFPTKAQGVDVTKYQKWYFDLLKVREAHEISKGKGQVIAVLDTGVHVDTPELKGALLPGRGFDASNTDGTESTAQHGTAMATVAAGRGGEGRVLGIAPDAMILPVGISGLDEFAFGGGGDVAAGIRWAADNGATVINLSISSKGGREHESIAGVNYALSKGIVVVVSAGNVQTAKTTSVVSLASIPGVIAVTGLDKAGGFWSGSTFGSQAVIAAPAEQIIHPCATFNCQQGYSLGDGTSAAAAIVSGVTALVRAKYPDLSAPDVINRLITTAVDLGPPGRDEQFGFGRIDPVAALNADVPTVATNPLGVAEVPPDPFAPDRFAPDPPFLKTPLGIAAVALPAMSLAIVVVTAVMVRRRAPGVAAANGPAPGAGPPGPSFSPHGPPAYGQPPYAPQSGQPNARQGPSGEPWPGQSIPTQPPPGQSAPDQPAPGQPGLWPAQPGARQGQPSSWQAPAPPGQGHPPAG